MGEEVRGFDLFKVYSIGSEKESSASVGVCIWELDKSA